jgi:hypothetical protein
MQVQTNLQGSHHIVEVIAIDALGRVGSRRVLAPGPPAEITSQQDSKGPFGVEFYWFGFLLFSQVNRAETGSG